VIATDTRCPERLGPLEITTRKGIVISAALQRQVIADESAEQFSTEDIGPIGEPILVTGDLQGTHPPPARSPPCIDKWRLDRSVTAIQP
jgi:hypothetical protein